MPATALTNRQKVENKCKQWTRDIKIQLIEAGISQQAVADAAGISQGSLANQFRRGHLTFDAYVAAKELLEQN